MFGGVRVFNKSEEWPEWWLLRGRKAVSPFLRAHIVVLGLVLKLKLTSWTGSGWSRGRVWLDSARAGLRGCVVGGAERLLR